MSLMMSCFRSIPVFGCYNMNSYYFQNMCYILSYVILLVGEVLLIHVVFGCVFEILGW